MRFPQRKDTQIWTLMKLQKYELLLNTCFERKREKK